MLDIFQYRNIIGWNEQVEFMHFCSTKQATSLLNLKSLCETGDGNPYPDDLDIS